MFQNGRRKFYFVFYNYVLFLNESFLYCFFNAKIYITLCLKLAYFILSYILILKHVANCIEEFLPKKPK
jgi:hypothetical protein